MTGLDSRELRVAVRKQNPATLDAALQCAFQMQAIQSTESASNAPQVVAEVCAVQTPQFSANIDRLCKRLDQLEARLDNTQTATPAFQAPQGGRRRCYVCESVLHLARDCPHNDRRPQSGNRFNQSGNRQ
ncbi:uncharacterized protein LOC135816917 [Sycon ciliatum]|uniref:uncharacterized protein LOC135816917 n=1 Tax=Sycon ciliatum TaxID=27933 RepID=UPI0031F69AA4